jgi:hypothetical protein
VQTGGEEQSFTAQDQSSLFPLHEEVPRAMDHHSSGCLPAEKFPTFASGRQGRGPVRLLGFRLRFDLTRRVMLFRNNHRHTGMDLRDELIGLACDDRASAQPFSGFGIFLSFPKAGEGERAPVPGTRLTVSV